MSDLDVAVGAELFVSMNANAHCPVQPAPGDVESRSIWTALPIHWYRMRAAAVWIVAGAAPLSGSATGTPPGGRIFTCAPARVDDARMCTAPIEPSRTKVCACAMQNTSGQTP